MAWSRIRRLLAFPGRNRSARKRWDYIGRDEADAYRMMDGSSCEEELCERGGRMADVLVRALNIRPDHRVLEVGCGVARLGREVAPHCRHYQGVDISRRLLDRARIRTSHLPNIELTHLPGPGLSGLPTGHYHRLISHLVFLHMGHEEIRVLLHDFARVLRADGAAYFDLWNLRHPDAWDLFRRESLDARTRRQPHRSRFYTRESVDAWLSETELDAVWVSDGTFLIQVVAVRRDADGESRQALDRTLDAEGAGLLPRGRLDFWPAGPGLSGEQVTETCAAPPRPRQ